MRCTFPATVRAGHGRSAGHRRLLRHVKLHRMAVGAAGVRGDTRQEPGPRTGLPLVGLSEVRDRVGLSIDSRSEQSVRSATVRRRLWTQLRAPPQRVGKVRGIGADERAPVTLEHGLVCCDADHHQMVRSDDAIRENRVRADKRKVAMMEPIVPVSCDKAPLAVLPGWLASP